MTPEQVAEGVRLWDRWLAVKNVGEWFDAKRQRAYQELGTWLFSNAPALLSAAQRVAELEAENARLKKHLEDCGLTEYDWEQEPVDRMREDQP